MKLSFVMPVYNSEKYLSQCLDSILDQNTDDFEIVCLNDGSKDRSLEILNEYAERYPGKFNIISQENQGIGPARNNAFKAVKGKYTWFIDNDDGIQPNCLKDLFSQLDEFSPDIMNISHIYGYFEKNPFPSSLDSPLKARKISQEFAMYFYQDAPWSKIYSTDFLRKNGMHFPNIFGEDTSTTFDLYSKTKEICLIEKPLYAWFEHNESFSHAIFSRKHFETFPILLETLKKQSENAPENLRVFYENLMLRKAFHFLPSFKEAEIPSDLIETRDLCIKKSDEILKDFKENIYFEIYKADEKHYRELWLARKKKEQEIKTSYESTVSWKITKPVRALKKFLKKI